MGQAANAVVDFVRWVGDRFGISPRDETFVDIQISPLLTPGSADKNARQNCIRGSNGSLVEYGSAYKSFQRNYKKSYNKQFIKRLGYLPTTTGTTRILDHVKVLDYLQTKDSLAVNLRKIFIKFITAEEAAYDWMEDNINWSNANRTIDIGDGKTWVDLVVSENSTTIYMDFTRDCEETIIENLTNNYSYAAGNSTVTLQTGPNTYEITGTTGVGCTNLRLTIDDVDFHDAAIVENEAYVIDTPSKEPGVYHIKVYEAVDSTETLVGEYDITIVGSDELYGVPEFDCTNQGGYYRTVVTLQGGTEAVNIDTTVETLQYTISINVLDGEKMYVEYDRGSVEWYHYVENLDTVSSNLYTSTNIDMTAIIPLKENNVIINGGIKQERMLKKLGIAPEMFVDSLQSPEIDNAYVLMGLYPSTQSNGGKKAIFNMFDLVQEGSGDVSITMQALNMTYSFTMDKSVESGLVIPVGTYSNELLTEVEASATYYTRTLIYQATTSQHKKIVITNYLQTYNIHGESVQASFGDNAVVSRLIVPLTTMNRLPYRDWVEVYEESLAMLAYAEEEVHFEWYESRNFSIVMKIVQVVVTIVGVILAIPSGGTSLSLVTAIEFVVNVVINMAIIWSIKQIVQYLVDIMGLDPAIAALVVMVVTAVVAITFPGSIGMEQWLPIANAGVEQANASTQAEVVALMEEAAENSKEFEEKNEHVRDLYEALNGHTDVIKMYCKDILNEQSPEEIANLPILQADQEFLCNWFKFYDIDGQINKKISVA